MSQLTNMKEQAAAAFLVAYLCQYGLDKSAVEDIANAARIAGRFASHTLDADPAYDPEIWEYAGKSSAETDQENQVNPSLSALAEYTECGIAETIKKDISRPGDDHMFSDASIDAAFPPD